MSISLYELSVGTYLQLLSGTLQVLDKGAQHFKEQGVDADTVLDDGICPDMLPLSFQLRSVAHHSLGCIRGLEAGLFQPPPEQPTRSYAEYQHWLAEVKTELEGISPEQVAALSGRPVLFKMGDFELPFIAENFVLSFSLPNFYFHTTTTYNLLRKQGVKLGKADYLGPMKFNQ